MISGIKRQPRRGPFRLVVARLEDGDRLECGDVVPVRAAKRRGPQSRERAHPRRRCDFCYWRSRSRRMELEQEARAV